MGRMVYLLMGIVAINLALLIFSCGSWDADGSCVAGSGDVSVIWNFITNPSSFDSSNFWTIFFGTVSGLAALTSVILFVGSFFMKVEFPLYASMTLVLVYPVMAWIKLFNQVAGSKLFAGGTTIPNSAVTVEGTIMAIIIAVPFIITYIVTAVDWARGRD
jgi:hypothetical protein